MSTLDAALGALRSAIKVTLASANITPRGKVLVGWPTASEWEEIAGQAGEALVSIWPMPGASYADPNPINYQITSAPAPGTTATLNESGTVLTIGGTPKAGDTIHAFFNFAAGDASYLVAAGNEPSTIAAVIAAAANAFAFPDISAEASGDAVTLTGSYFEKVNIGGAGVVAAEVARVRRSVQVTVWTSAANDSNSTPALNDRQVIGEAIIANVGTALTQWLTDASGDFVYCTQMTDRWSDEPSDSYTTFRWDIYFDIVYSIMQQQTTAQLGSVMNIVANHIPATLYVN